MVNRRAQITAVLVVALTALAGASVVVVQPATKASSVVSAPRAERSVAADTTGPAVTITSRASADATSHDSDGGHGGSKPVGPMTGPPLPDGEPLVTDMVAMAVYCDDAGVVESACSYAYYKAYAEAYGVKASFVDIEALKVADRTFIPWCHHAYHSVGQAAPSLMTVTEALAISTPLCQAGYIHGVVQAWSTSVTPEEARVKADTLCAPLEVEGKSPMVPLCGHGLGHALAILHPLDVIAAATLCAPLHAEIAAGCLEGVIMEFAGKDLATTEIRAELGSAPKDSVTPAQRAELCVKIPESLRDHCYMRAFQLWDDVIEDGAAYSQRCEAGGTKQRLVNCGRAFGDFSFWTKDPLTIESSPEVLVARWEPCATLTNTVIADACRVGVVETLWRDEPIAGAPLTTVCPYFPAWGQEQCAEGEKLALTTRLIS